MKIKSKQTGRIRHWLLFFLLSCSLICSSENNPPPAFVFTCYGNANLEIINNQPQHQS